METGYQLMKSGNKLYLCISVLVMFLNLDRQVCGWMGEEGSRQSSSAVTR